MTTYGVTPQGFVLKPLEAIKQEVGDRLHADIDAGLDLTAESALGQAFAIFCEALGQMWEVAEAVSKASDPDAAVGAWLDAVCALTGTQRNDAAVSTASVNVTTSQAVNVAAGDFVVSVAGNPAARFVNADPIVTAAAGTVAVRFEAEETGPVVANAGTLTTIETPVSGVSSVTNPLDAVLGANIEEDDGLRTRREDELDAIGAGTLDSIRARLLDVDGVLDAIVYENTGDVVDASGRPPHSIQAVVLGGTPAAIAQAIWDVKGGGTATYGAQALQAVDSRGKSQTVNFDLAAQVDLYVEVDLSVLADEYPADGDDQVKAAIVAKGDSSTLGQDAVVAQLRAAALSVPGVYDLTAFRIGTTPGPVGTVNVAIAETEVADFDTARIVVNATPVVP